MVLSRYELEKYLILIRKSLHNIYVLCDVEQIQNVKRQLMVKNNP